MNNIVQFNKTQYRNALDRWLAECKRRMGERFPKIDFDSDHWPVQSLYQTSQLDWTFEGPNRDFANKDRSFCEVTRCLVAEMTISGKPKGLLRPISAFRRLAATPAASIFDITLSDLRTLEAESLLHCKKHPIAANRHHRHLVDLTHQFILLAKKAVLPHLGFRASATARAELRSLEKSTKSGRTSEKGTLLDHKMEALNDAINALVDRDPRLDSMDQVTICALIRELCAPSRINEVLCSSIDDHLTVEDYAQKTPDMMDVRHSAHQLLITMKGSKGAQWSAKPALSFMIDAFHYTEDVIKKCGKRSRMLVQWYQDNPNILYLPPELESLRGTNLSFRDVSKIMHLTDAPGEHGRAVDDVFSALIQRRFAATNPKRHDAIGRPTSRKLIYFLP